MRISAVVLLHVVLFLAAVPPVSAIPVPPSNPSQIDTMLLEASLAGNDVEVGRLLSAGANPDARRDDEWTALMLAAMNGHTSIVRRLLDRGAAIDVGSPAEGTALCVASLSPIDPPEGPTAVVRLLLERGADRNRGNSDGMTPLMFATREGKADVVQILIAAGADVDRGDVRGWTALRFAARSGDTTILRLLLTARANPNVREYDAPLTPLDHAVAGGSPIVVSMLLRGGADPNGIPVANGYSPTPLLRAVQIRNLEIVRLLVAARASPNFVVSNEDGDRLVSALDIATEAGDKAMIKLLKNAGARSNVHEIYRSLMVTIVGNDAESVRRLMELGIDPRIDFMMGDSSFAFLKQSAARGYAKIVAALLDFRYAFHPQVLYDAWSLARDNGREDVVDLLLKRSPGTLATMAAQNDDAELLEKALDRSDTIITMMLDGGQTLLHVAAYHGSRESVELLLKRGAAIVRDDWSQRTPIYDAVLGGDTGIIAMLITAGDSADRRDESMWTPLHLAAHSKHHEVMQLLVASGAPIESPDDRGWRALHYAARSGDPVTVAKLIELGADRNARTLQNQTPLDVARESGSVNERVIELLTK